MTAEPLVSVLLPAYNAAATLAACLRSIQRQSESRWECVIVDDGSSDDTGLCARWFADRDPRFVIVATPHRGLIHALNVGLESCRAPLVARMDADDLMHRDRLQEQRCALDRDDALAAVGCHVRLFPRGQLRDGLRVYEAWLNAIASPRDLRAEAFVECPLAHPSLMIRRAVLRDLCYRDVGWAEDYDLVLRLLQCGAEIGVVPRRLLAWRDGPQRHSRRDPRYGLDRFTECKAAFLASGLLARHDAYILWGYGDTGKALRRALACHGKQLAYVIEVDPRRVGNTIHGAPVLSPVDLPHLPRHPVVASVAGTEPRRQIRAAMADMGFRELEDFVCAA